MTTTLTTAVDRLTKSNIVCENYSFPSTTIIPDAEPAPECWEATNVEATRLVAA